ncbi:MULTISPECIES: NAD(P)/FAD-dependent oxidoreductase [Paenibacillus]|uniref:Monooxygenase n=1 Tax=Paenibacillus campinasensis TaxID=66347 RepID=A0ABW9T5E3_9BACL|nr:MULTISPECIES: NAD(P)/FAD-dependent oxidoreductase [Paenibacillus]MUG66381.1 monooxygenase [Paenibacillus campinasensis]PAK54423.1 monooxygenase [Paenibacillus sp. 7541]
MMEILDCIIVGGGAAGVGLGSLLQELGVTNFSILERGSVGASFRMWPKEMRMITPSFTGNAYGMLDLNSVTLKTSPAYTLGTEHPSGEQYADYLQAVADYKELPIQTGVDVTGIRPQPDGGFELDTSAGIMRCNYVIWAAGEFQYPALGGLPGSEYGIHSSLVKSWKEFQGDEHIIIGGYESGADAAIHLARLGKKVTVIDRSPRWTLKGSSDPSMEISPYTKDRLREVEGGLVDLMAGYEAKWIEPADDGGYLVYCEGSASGDSRFVKTTSPPILATGFRGSLSLIEHLFECDEHGAALLNEYDESTVTPGLFVAGPSVRHEQLIFCFIYKFRQRFGVVAGAIAERLGLDTSVLEAYRQQGMLLEDLSCCGEDCQC